MFPLLGQSACAALNSLPAKRKKAGLQAHRKVYKQLLQYHSFTKINKFLELKHPDPKKVKYRLFFEVSLGPRIVDVIVLTSYETERVCYVVELKTCLGSEFNFTSVRAAQRTQGLCQLYDSTKYLSNNAPLGGERWEVRAHLLFKSQSAMKTLYVEHPGFQFNQLQCTTGALSVFLKSREDVACRQLLYQGLQCAALAKKMRVLGTKSTKRARDKPTQVSRVPAQRSPVQKARGRKQAESHKKGASKGRAG
ncbi:ORF20 [Alcelaphine gammaherpesvirus 1]|uniref:Protein UL24 homolog n=1 Tax=Alcelaphine herpesvirus 1 (strain C500) TaxID=654901 RepID=UL24_ALHV1|nr:ORF20 [Alcelaphine gammaherpesvirus 1]O36370.1 RecName: Full=Protein UL24 homolog [Alcelaphine herpesvirus 1 strain C500]AAC58067.1 ORF20 [Alcelaphine gammaherpesvirus 1]APB09446.1 nuclear protein UL24 [Alcelaphine gammaherpesvirus 1]APB09518.1 nuclear protein UL24 [Alcelaphine gammaherpesvirus 1]ATI21908.1 ORF20 [Alcelaphine gammaherpesvirus 1]QDY92252.1 nuclear protein UL24 [Alcelaphine gammaherpesvirus 1]